MSDAAYAFLSVVRRGLAALVRPGLPPGAARVGVPVQFSVGGAPVTGLPQAALRGPGDVAGFDAGAVRRTWPPADARGAEPSYFALAELDEADLPWRYTPDATEGDRLAPWLCLIVVEDGEITGRQRAAGPGRPLPAVTVADAGVLPDLSQSWAWAHGQVLGAPDAPETDFDAASVAGLLAQAPSRLLARLLCPRQLQPRQSYQAFVVPAYKRGRLAGTGQPAGNVDRLAPAWQPGQGAVTLPVYASWSFQTGDEGDFASLAAKLHPVAGLQRELWQRQLAVSPPGAAPSAWQGADLEGALIPVGAVISDWAGIDAHGFTSALQARVNAKGSTLEPPLYGRWLAAADSLSTDPAATPPWFHQLNADPRARVAAGLGTVIVQAGQQQLLAGAWAQVAGIRAANETLRLAQLARELALRVYARHVSALDAAGLLALSAPLHGRVRAGSGTVLAQLAASPVAPGALAPAWRRLARPLGTLAVRQGRPVGPPVAAGQDAIARMNNGRLEIVPPAPGPPAQATGAAARLGDLGTIFASIHLAPEQLRTVTPPGGFVLSHPPVLAAQDVLAAQELPAALPAPVVPPVVPPAPPAPVRLPPEVDSFAQAAAALMTQLARAPAAGTTWLQASLGAADTAIRTTLNPVATIQAPLASRLSGAVSGPRRTDPLEPVIAAPAFPQPMYQPLASLDTAWLLPGLGSMPANAVALFTTNWRFVESFLVGLNHEMARKLLWNGYPTDQRGTYFRHFWDSRGNVSGDGSGDIGPVHQWAGPLGKNRPAAADPLVLLVRGELIRRYPNVVVYAAQAVAGATGRQPGPAETQPMFFARVGEDIALFGFDIDPAAARGDPGWFFVLQEHPSEPRFGLSAPGDNPAYGVQPSSWQVLGWEHLAASAAELAALRFIDLNAALPQNPPGPDPAGAVWHAGGSPGSRAADIAYITLRRPARLAVHGSILIPPPPPASAARPRFPAGRHPVTLDGRYPVALLPVRLETRFAGSLLRVRIFPDEIFADTHEPGLTPEESTDGTAYVAAMQAGTDAERSAWGQLAARWTAPRAAFIAQAAAAGATQAQAESWTRAAEATLPDHWIVRAFEGANVYTVTSGPVRKPLALTLSPAATLQDRVTIAGTLTIDEALQWTVDFAAAEAAGMAVTIDLTRPDQVPAAPPDPSAGVDLVLVIGVSDSAAPADGAAQLQALIDAHHWTRGVAFLRPGTPTGNTPESPSAFPPPDPGGTASFAVERGAPLVAASSPPGANGRLFTEALGLPLAVAGHLDGAGTDGDAAAAAMNDALWPATLGYCMEQLMAPPFSAADVAGARTFWTGQVRPGGPLPALRIGRVPYGLLPAVSLSRLADSRLVHALRALRDGHFVSAAGGAPRITAGSADPDGDLLKVLALDASSSTARIRVLLGQEFTANTAAWLGPAPAAAQRASLTARSATAAALLSTTGLGGDTRLGGLDASKADELIGTPFVTSGPLSEEAGLGGADGSGLNYIQWLHDNALAHADAVRTDALPGAARPLLYRLLRHALLTEMDRLAFRQLLAAGTVAAADHPEAELVQLTPADVRLTSYQRIARVAGTPAFAASLSSYLGRLLTLAPLPTAELARRFGEALDACSHRLDAWISAVAAQRLGALRAANQAGCHVGGYGWVEDVRSAAPGPWPGGFVHAPSAAQASAAAVLRNGYLSRGGSGSAYDVDLSSARVRDALGLIYGTRQGEQLASLLGQRFERDLHQRELDQLIAPLRAHFPLVAGKTPAGDGPVELVAAGNVVDGLALRRAWDAKSPPFSGASDLPPVSAAQLDSFHAALDALDDAVDGVADLLTAESVFQAVRGNPVAAAASLDAMAQGVLPPRPEVARTPVSGTSFTQRLAVALDSSAVPGGGPWGPRTPRAAAEPVLDNWVATLLGPPAQIGCRVRFPDASTHEVVLSQLALRPLDFVALARTPPAASGDGELDRRVLQAAAAPAGAQIVYDASSAPVTFTAALELARTVGELLAVARPLLPADLVTPATAAPAPGQAEAAQAAARAQAALAQLTAAGISIDQELAAVTAAQAPTAAQLTALSGALRGAAEFGIGGAYTADTATAADLTAMAPSVRQELTARAAAAPPLTATDPAALVAAATEAMSAVFGRDFLFLPELFAPALEAPLAASGTLVGDPDLPRQALQQLARVRQAIGRWRSLWLYAQALGAAQPALDVAQLPQAATWAGRPGATIPDGTLSLIVHRPTGAAPQRGWAGLLIDEWNETVPAPVQHTALSFRYQAPVAEAPQVVLLAVPPTDDPAWDTEALFDTVRDTLALAKLRAVDGSNLDGLRPFLPAIFLTGNTANEAVSTNFLGSLVHDPQLGKT